MIFDVIQHRTNLPALPIPLSHPKISGRGALRDNLSTAPFKIAPVCDHTLIFVVARALGEYHCDWLVCCLEN